MAKNLEEKQQGTGAAVKKGASAGHTALSVLGAVLCVILVPILIINCTLIVRSLIKPDEVPRVGGVFPLIVMTDSMYPVIHSGDLIICRTVDAEELAVGDVIAFVDPEGNGTSLVTHRIIGIETQDGAPAFRTQGDANNTADPSPVPAENLVGRYTTRLAGVGNVVLFMQTTPGLLVCVVLPIILLVGYDIIRRRVYEKRHAGDQQALLRELEELRAQQSAGNPAETDTPVAASSDRDGE